MKRVPVQVSREAFTDMAVILFQIEQTSSQNADIVQAAFDKVLEQLTYTPTLRHTHAEIGDDSIRFVPFKSLEAACRFENGVVKVSRVVHSARDYTQIDFG